jgi:hypothetical protein
MNRLLTLLCLLLVPCFSFAQSAVTVTGLPFNSGYTWAAMTATGVTPVSLYTLNGDGAPSNFTIDAVTTGTAPTTCTFEVESSPDAVNWNSGAGSLSGSLDCHAAGLLTTSFLSKPVRYLRVKLNTLTGGDGTTAITFSYTRGLSR